MTPPILFPNNVPTEPGGYALIYPNGNWRYVTVYKSGSGILLSTNGNPIGSFSRDVLWSDLLPDPIVQSPKPRPPHPRVGCIWRNGGWAYVVANERGAPRLAERGVECKDVHWYDEATPIEEQT